MAAEGAEVEEQPRQPVPPLDDEQIEERSKLWEEIFSELPANKVKLASIEERKANEKTEDASLTYGELDFKIVNNIITMLKNQHISLYAGQGMFLDLGSGCGKACVAAALAHRFEKVVGIETMVCLDEFAQKVNVDKYAPKQLTGDPPPEKPEIQFIKGDFVADLAATLEPLAPQIAICMAVATCFGDDQMNALATLASKMPDDSVIVTFSQSLPDWIIGGDKKLPQERYRDLLKAGLTKRGTDPSTVQIDQNPPDAKPGGWRLVHEEEAQLPVGKARGLPPPPMQLPTKYFVFKKIPLPVVEQPPAADGEQPAEES